MNAEPPNGVDLRTLALAELQRRLGFSADGLDPAAAAERLRRYGANEIVEREAGVLEKLLSYFWGPIPWMIEAAVILSALVRRWPDFSIILTLLVANAGVGFWEERQAGNAIAALKARLAPSARVRRAGAWAVLPARDLVPGDLVRIRLGDIVPADVRLLDEAPIEVDQSQLTGESLPVARGLGDAVFSGSIVRRGEVDAIVYATGTDTYFGRTARLVGEARGLSHFQRAVLKIGDYLIALAVALVVVIVLVALFRGDPPTQTLQFALVLLVAAIPVAMPTVLSVTMAVGAHRLADREAIVTRLAAIEELAGMDVLCSDKTGTLTENRLTLGTPFCEDGVAAADLILCAALASRAEDADAIDRAVLAGVPQSDVLRAYRVTRFRPFDPVAKRTEASVVAPDGARFDVAKGAPQVILAMTGDEGTSQARAEQAVAEFAARGFRSLAVARTDASGRWRLLGILPLFDPPRAEARATLEAARRMGVAVKMLTGDQIAIARETAATLGLGANILDAAVFADAGHLEAAKLADSIERADGFAQVYPEHKYHIVDVLRRHGHIVGMTGDGVNDAPALKRADCGIAVSGATDAARAAASIVLLTPGLSVIVDAVKESRKIFQRMNSYATYRIAESLRVLLFMTMSILVFNFYPLTAVMIVILALLNDGAILSIAYDRVRYRDHPEVWEMRTVLGVATVLGFAGVASAFLLFYVGERVLHLDRAAIQTLMYLKLSVAGHLTVFLTRTRGPFWSVRPAGILVVAVLGTQLIATLLAVYGVFMSPLGWRLALGVWAYALVWFLINDAAKRLAYRLFAPANAD